MSLMVSAVVSSALVVVDVGCCFFGVWSLLLRRGRCRCCLMLVVIPVLSWLVAFVCFKCCGLSLCFVGVDVAVGRSFFVSRWFFPLCLASAVFFIYLLVWYAVRGT